MVRGDPRGSLNPLIRARWRHPDVGDDDIRIELVDHGPQAREVRRLAHHLYVVDALQKTYHALAQQSIVLGDDHPLHRRHHDREHSPDADRAPA